MIIAQTRVSPETLATLAKFWAKRGHHMPSISYLIRTSLETLAELQQDVEATVGMQNALNELDLFGLGVKSTRNVRNRNLITKSLADIEVVNFDDDAKKILEKMKGDQNDKVEGN